MLPNKSYGSGDIRRNSAPGRPKKKPPPRPPQPKPMSLKNSHSFQQLSSQAGTNTSGQLITGSGSANVDLIDFSAPPVAPQNLLRSGQTRGSFRESDEGVYRVGASIFYITSALENSSYHKTGHKSGNPFSPPRPSAQSMSGTPSKTVTSTDGQDSSRTNHVSYPTIIPSAAPKASVNSSQPSVSGANNGHNLPAQSQEPIAVTWDEPPVARTVVMPTIIKPLPAAKPTIVPKPVVRNVYDEPLDGFEEEVEEEESNYSEPIGSYQPPSKDTSDSSSIPKMSYNTTWKSETVETSSEAFIRGDHQRDSDRVESGESEQSYAIALYDYSAGAEGDLDLQAGDLVYLIKAIDDNWMYGSCGGTEGIFPSNYVNVIVPLPPDKVEEAEVAPNEPLEYRYYTQVQYQFVAESEKELSLEVNETVTVLGQINEDWLFGEKNGVRGRFPASFVGPVPLDVPTYP